MRRESKNSLLLLATFFTVISFTMTWISLRDHPIQWGSISHDYTGMDGRIFDIPIAYFILPVFLAGSVQLIASFDSFHAPPFLIVCLAILASVAMIVAAVYPFFFSGCFPGAGTAACVVASMIIVAVLTLPELEPRDNK